MDVEVILDHALSAYRQDDGLAVEMAQSARRILRKRQVWRLRSTLTEAETQARSRCRDAGVQVCAIQSPCGIGRCPFTPNESLRSVQVGPPARKLKKPTHRPVTAVWPTYSIEDAVTALAS